MANIELAQQEAMKLAMVHWLAAVALVGALVAVQICRRRAWVLVSGLGLLIVALHPRWTLPPIFGPDCAFINVQAAEALTVGLALLLGWQLLRWLRASRRADAPN